MHKGSVGTIQPHSIAHPALLLFVALTILLLTPSITVSLLRKTGCLRPNYRGNCIPAMFGISISMTALALFAIAYDLIPTVRIAILPWIALAFSFGALGFVDDKWGNKEIKGLKGHFSAALRGHQITSGLIKAVGGLAAGIMIGFWINPGNPAAAITAGVLIALCANGLNLLDLRPGRACAVYLLCATVLLAIAIYTPLPPAGELLVVCVLLPTLPAWILDSRAAVMIGDTGSNVLGASLGLEISETHNVTLQIVAIVMLLLLHVLAERKSITQIIANNRFLSSLDELTGVRE